MGSLSEHFGCPLYIRSGARAWILFTLYLDRYSAIFGRVGVQNVRQTLNSVSSKNPMINH